MADLSQTARDPSGDFMPSTGGAAFGFFPQMQPRRQGLPSDSANLPIDVLRGRIAGLFGFIPDMLNFMGRSPMPTETFGETQYDPRPQLPYDTEFYLKNLPLAPTSRAGQVAGQAASFVPLNPAPAIRAGVAGAKALAPTAARMTESYLQRQGLMPGVVPDSPSGLLGGVVQKPQAPVSELGFYSAAEQAAMNLARNKGTGQSFINDLMKAPDVKKDELAWTGLDDFLKDKPNVTKQEVQDFISKNKVDLQEVRLGESFTEDPVGVSKRLAIFEKYEPEIQALYKEMDSPRYRLVNRGMGAEEYNRGVVLQNRGYRGETLTAQEQSELDGILSRLDGNTVQEFANAEEARSVYLAMSPEERLQHSIRPVKSSTELQQEINLLQVRRDAEADRAYVIPEPAPTRYKKYQLPGGENYREILLTLPEKMPKTLPEGYSLQSMANGNFTLVNPDNIGTRIYAKSKDAAMEEAIRRFTIKEEPYRSSHFNEPNILAHMRVNDRVDADGKKMLLVEEIQSDWHQAGREKGYKGQFKDLPNDYKIESKTDKDGYSYYEVLDPQGNVFAKDYSKGSVTNQAINRLNETIGGVPDAPLKDTWYQLSLKRLLKYAADNGYDRVGLTTGKQQAKRYDLGNEVNSIDVESVEGVPNLQLVDIDVIGGQKIALEVENGVVREGEFAGKRLSDVVGKEMADKITNVAQGKTKSLAGEDLRLGGEGMKKYYDEIYPKFLEKYGKKWDAKVGETTIPTDRTRDAQGIPSMYPTKEPIRYIDITPKMKESVSKGQPLFSAAPAGALGLGGLEYTDPFGNLFPQQPQPQQSAQPIAVKPKTWDAAAAQRAKMLEDMGTDPKTIWQQTGTWKGPDGKWRQEVMQ